MKANWLLTILWLACVCPSHRSLAAETSADNEISIGAIYALTGEAGYWGTYGFNGFQLAIEEENAKGGINGKRINLLVQDSQTKPANAVSAYQ